MGENGKSPAFQMYTGDWFGSLRVGEMNVTEQGAYANLIFRAWEAEERGLPTDDAALARLSNAHDQWPKVRDKVVACFFERDGRLFHQRVLMERQKQQRWREKSRAGGLKSAENRARSKGGCTLVDDCLQPKANTSSSSSSSSSITTKPLSAEFSAAFVKFWESYPRKVGKREAWKSWERQKLDAKSEEILRATEKHKNSKEWLQDGGRFIPHPTTYLNQARWEDDLDIYIPQPQRPNPSVCPKCYGAGGTKDGYCDCPAGVQARKEAGQ